MSMRLSPFAELLPRAAQVGIINTWHVADTCIVMTRGSQTFEVGADELVDVLFDLTEEHYMQKAADANMDFLCPAA